MTETIDIINFVFAITGLVVAVLGLIMNTLLPYSDRISKVFFCVIFSLLIVYVASDLISQASLVLMGSDYSLLSRIAVFCESAFSSMIMPVLTAFIIVASKKDLQKATSFYISMALWFIYIVLLVSTWFHDRIYYITADNVYHRGPWYPALLVPPVLLMLVNLISVIANRRRLSSKQILAFSSYLLIPMICMLVQMFTYGLLMIVIGTCIAAFFMYLFITEDQISKHVTQREKIANARAANMALQMRPHFIYNVMTGIHDLIKTDPDKAQQVTLDFNKYLQKNYTAMGLHDTITFAEELEHVRTYLEVEKVIYEGSLFTEFQVPSGISFKIPPLTLQPLVENAVKRGIDPELTPLYITISASKKETGHEVVIEDTGIGYGATESNEPDLVIPNIRERLSLMCGGTISVSKKDNGGTRAVIFIPAVQ